MPSVWTAPRVRIEVLLDDADRRAALHDATFWSLRRIPKEIPAVWLYDERGSLLFDEITRLPEYYLTRREHEILAAHAPEIADRTGARTLVELGSGTSEKTRLLLDAFAAAGTLERFVPLDVSDEILRASALAIAAEYPTIGVHGIVGDFERHLGAIPEGGARVVAFLGSTIGNLEPERRARFLGAVGSLLQENDFFLLGIDLVKDPDRLEAAYNDTRGVTERFVRNGLAVVNRELGGDFNGGKLGFAAQWDAEHEWMDIGFIARSSQVVSFRELEVQVPLTRGEKLRFEISAKFRRAGVEHELAVAGLRLTDWWADEAGDFAVLLATR